MNVCTSEAPLLHFSPRLWHIFGEAGELLGGYLKLWKGGGSRNVGRGNIHEINVYFAGGVRVGDPFLAVNDAPCSICHAKTGFNGLSSE